MKKLLAALAVGAVGALVIGAPAFATNSEDGQKKVEKFRKDTSICSVPDLNYNNTKNLNLSGGATAETTPNGLELFTPVKADHSAKLSWKVTLPSAVDLDKLASAGYVLTKKDVAGPGVNDAALLSYDIVIDKDGNGTEDFTLVYEPYWQGANPARNVTKIWDVKSGKFWANKPAADTWVGNVPNGGGADNKTIAEINVLYPNAKIKAYGYHQGTYNDGTISLLTAFWFDTDDTVKEGYGWTSWCNKQKVEFKDTCDGTEVTLSNSVAYLESKFYINGSNEATVVGETKTFTVVGEEVTVTGKTKNFLAKHVWSKPATCASASPSTSVSVSPSASGSTVVGVPVSNPGTSLPVTGSKVALISGIGVFSLAVGIAILLVLRKRQDRTEFIAE